MMMMMMMMVVMILALLWPQNDLKRVKMVLSDHHLKKYSHSPIQTSGGVHLLAECSEFICFWATLAKFWPSSGHKMTENCGFRPLSKKVFTPLSEKVPLCGIMISRSISNMVLTLVRRVFMNYSIFLLHRPNLAPLVAISAFPFPLIRPQAGTCILGCLVLFMKLHNSVEGDPYLRIMVLRQYSRLTELQN